MQLPLSRHNDPTPVRCESCGWEGRVKNCNHTYKPDGLGDMEGVDYCPLCGSDQLIPIEEEPVTV